MRHGTARIAVTRKSTSISRSVAFLKLTHKNFIHKQHKRAFIQLIIAACNFEDEVLEVAHCWQETYGSYQCDSQEQRLQLLSPCCGLESSCSLMASPQCGCGVRSPIWEMVNWLLMIKWHTKNGGRGAWVPVRERSSWRPVVVFGCVGWGAEMEHCWILLKSDSCWLNVQ